MKKIAYLILMLTCQHLWAWNNPPIVGIYEVIDSSYFYINTVDNYFYLQVNDSNNLLPDLAAGGAQEYRISVDMNFRYTFVNSRGEQRILDVPWKRSTIVGIGVNRLCRLLWRRPTPAQIAALEREGFYLGGTARGVEVSLRTSYSLFGGYIVDNNNRFFRDGPISSSIPNGILSDDNPWDDEAEHFRRAWTTWYHFLGVFIAVADSGGWQWNGNDQGFRRHLAECSHDITKFSIRQTIDNDRLPKTTVSFDTSMFATDVEKDKVYFDYVHMEHVFRLVYKYTYGHRITGGNPETVTMTKMVNALIPTGKKKVQGTVYAPLPTWQFRLKMLLTLRSLDKIKVTLESPHMLPVNQSSAYYYDGPYNKISDGNKFDDHPLHTWDRICTTGHHGIFPFKEIPFGLDLSPSEAVVRSED